MLIVNEDSDLVRGRFTGRNGREPKPDPEN